jgi:hypothetical protein
MMISSGSGIIHLIVTTKPLNITSVSHLPIRFSERLFAQVSPDLSPWPRGKRRSFNPGIHHFCLERIDAEWRVAGRKDLSNSSLVLRAAPRYA